MCELHMFAASTPIDMAKFTLQDFRKQFPTDGVCLDRIFNIRYGHLTHCPSCNLPAKWKRITTRRAHHCRHCYEQIYATAGTPFEKTTTPLSSWFYVIFLMTTTRNGVAAKEIERQLGVTYKTAWRMGHKIRSLMDRIGAEKLKGFVEIDEVWISAHTAPAKNKEYRLRFDRPNKHKTEGKFPVVGMVERTGEVRAFKISNINHKSIIPLINKNVDKSAIIHTDEHHVYTNIPSITGNAHESIKHSLREYKIGRVTTNTIEGFFSQLRRTIEGNHIHISGKYLQNYLNECCFRYNNRLCQETMFFTMLNNVGQGDIAKKIQEREDKKPKFIRND